MCVSARKLSFTMQMQMLSICFRLLAGEVTLYNIDFVMVAGMQPYIVDNLVFAPHLWPFQ